MSGHHGTLSGASDKAATDLEEELKELCSCNGINDTRLDQEGPKTRVLEIFFSGFPKMISLHHFPNLYCLCVMGQTIGKIEGLTTCRQLRELWVSECKITRIENLNYNRMLSKLYLYGNEIEQIEHLDLLTDLEIIDLHANKIKNIEGFQNLKKLKDLNLSGNIIDKIGNGLNCLTRLEILNLSGNKISSFKDITCLVRLSSLRVLGLKDPMYSPNPVCLLCNYSTHVVFHLPNLVRLDGFDTTNKPTRDLAETTVLKKKMYYNMRIKTIRCNQASLIKKLISVKEEVYCKIPEERLRLLYSAYKEVEREISELGVSNSDSEAGGESGTESDKDTSETQAQDRKTRLVGYEDKMHLLERKIKKWETKIKDLDYYYTECCNKVKITTDTEVSHIVTELESGGNIRFEEGKPSDVWFTSCQDLLLSRFCVGDYKQYGISGIKIHKITRLHNRILHTRFDEKLDSLIEDPEMYLPTSARSSAHKLLEYLFWVWDPDLPGGINEPNRVLEEGFLDAATYKKLGREGAVPFSNSLMLSDKLRIQYMKKQAQSKPLSDPCPFRFGQIVIAKAYLGRSTQADHNIQKAFYAKHDAVFRPRKADKSKPGSDLLHQSCDCLSRHCEWFLFDHELILPEYIISFEYITTFMPAYPFAFLDNIDVLESLDKQQVSIRYTGEDESEMEILSMEPVVKPRPRLITLTEDLILKLSSSSSLSNISELNLHGNGLAKLKPINQLPSLKKLIISFNDLIRLDDVTNMHLDYLDASFNRISSLDGMKNMSCLKYLDISWNKLFSTREEMAILRKHCPVLNTLDFTHNPWHKPDGLRLRTIGRLKSLSLLNGQLVTESEATAALRMAAGSRISQVSILSHSRTHTSKPRSLYLGFCAQSLTNSSWEKPDRLAEQDNSWYSKVSTLNLDGQHLSKLSNLDRLENLKWLSLNHNDITKIEGLDPCVNLEELSLEDNSITKIEGLIKLTELQCLNLSDNYISMLDSCLDKLTNLYHLSIENNKISSLFGVHRITTLVELYAGNNNITNVREVFYLKNLSNFLILDIGGNPVVESTDNYRLFVVYHLKTLKALDGQTVESQEAYQAKEAYGGRLTSDFVAERLGHSSFVDVRELDLPNCGIRTVDLGDLAAFINLRSINLEHNNMTSFSGLINLVNLRVLCLNHNHIESIVPKPKAATAIMSTKVTKGSNTQPSVLSSKDLFDPEKYSPVLENLEVLHLGYNGIKELADLQLGRLPSLKALFLQGNEITKVEGLEGLQDLRELVLDRNKIKNIAELSFMNQWNLQELHMEENRLRDLNNLSSLESLQRLYLGMNRIQDLAELDKLENFQHLVEFSVVGNAVSRRLLHRPMLVYRMPSLMVIDGIPVSDEERVKADIYFMDQQSVQQVMTTVETTLPGIGQYKTQIPVKVTNVQLAGPDRMPWGGTIQYSDDLNQGYRRRPNDNVNTTTANIPNQQKMYYSSQTGYHPTGGDIQHPSQSDLNRANYHRSQRK